MSKFETVIIANPDTDISSLITMITNELTNIIYCNEMGTRTLAYDIKGCSKGFYIEIAFTGTLEDLTKLESFLRIRNDVLKFITMKIA